MVDLVRTAMHPLHGEVSYATGFVEMVWYGIIDPFIETHLRSGMITASRWQSCVIPENPTLIDAQDLFYIARREKSWSTAAVWANYHYWGNPSATLMWHNSNRG